MKAQNLGAFIKRITLCSSNEGDIVPDPLDFAQGKFSCLIYTVTLEGG